VQAQLPQNGPVIQGRNAVHLSWGVSHL
jgi:hypothetical protein